MDFDKGVYEKFPDMCMSSVVQLTCFGLIIVINNKRSLRLSKKVVEYPSLPHDFHLNNISQETENRDS